MDSTSTQITNTALYKLCREVYLQYKAQHEHRFNDELAKLHSDVEEYLEIEVDKLDGDIDVMFTLKRSDVNG